MTNDFVLGQSLNSGVGYQTRSIRVRLSLHTRPIVRRELVRDKAIQEGINLVRDVSPALMIQMTNTHRICPLGEYLPFDPVNEIRSQHRTLFTRTNGRIIQAHSEPDR